MNFNIIPAFKNIQLNKPAFKSQPNKTNTNPILEKQPTKDSFELSIGYVNDIHGQTNNMMRILSGLKGDLKLSAGDNDIGDEKNKLIHKATVQFMNLADIKASALGNHEFDTTQADFIKSLENMDAKMLSVNLKKVDNWESRTDNLPEYERAKLDDKLAKSTIVNVKGENVGIIGASPIDMFDRLTHPNYHKDCKTDTLESTVKEIQEEVDNMKKQGINKIVLLSHLGLAKDKMIAPKLDGVDVIIGGHTHELVKDIKEGKNLFYTKSGEPIIITEAGRDGNYFGQLNLEFDKDGVITKAQNNIGDTSNFSKNLVNQYLFDKIMGEPEDIGYIHSAPLPPKTLIEENPHANFVCDAMRDITNADIGVWNNSGIRNFFHEGAIDSRDIKDIAPFLDRVSVANVSEKTIVDMFKRAVYETCTSHGHKPGLLAVSGLNYTVNKSTGEILEMNFIDKDGKETPIDLNNPRENKFYRLTTDEFMMSADADYNKLAAEEDCLEIYPYDKDVMTCQYIKKLNIPVTINQTGRIRFVD